MRILIPLDNPYTATNPYVSTLIDGLKNIDKNLFIDYGCSKFWSEECMSYDIVHIMWPNFLLNESGKKHSLKELIKRLQLLRDNHVHIVSTCHNFKPHYDCDKDQVGAYDAVYQMSEIIFHLGAFSKQVFDKKYPASNNILLYHHIYDSVYTKIPTKAEARKRLGLRQKKTYILCFGAFRSFEERKMILQLSKELKVLPYIGIIAPGLYPVRKRRNVILLMITWIKYMVYSVSHRNIYKKLNGFVEDSWLPFYFSACDIALIQRVKILNSGNLPLNFYFGNVVVGPSVGNVGSLLRQTGNPVFDPNKLPGSLFNAIQEGLLLQKEGKGEENKQFALSNFKTADITRTLYNAYSGLLK